MATPLKIQIIVDDDGSVKVRQFGQEAERAGRKGKEAFHKTGRSLDEMNRHAVSAHANILKIASAVAAAWAAVRTIESLKNAASDLNETVSKSNTIFAANADEIMQWSKTSATAFGLSQQAALENASTLGNMFKQLGAGTDIAAANSRQMVQLSADIASFHNVAGGATQVLEAMQASFRGEYDSLQRYIPTINAATVEQQALAETGRTSAKELTALEKATAAMTIIIRDAGDATGDFARTADQAANQERILNAQIEDAKAGIGQGLLPIYREILVATNQWIQANKNLIATKVRDWVDTSVDGIRYMADALTAFARVELTLKKAQYSGQELALKFKLWANMGEASEQKIRKELIATQQVIADVTNAILELDKAHDELYNPGLQAAKEALNEANRAAQETADVIKDPLTKNLGTAAEAMALTQAETDHLTEALAKLEKQAEDAANARAWAVQDMSDWVRASNLAVDDMALDFARYMDRVTAEVEQGNARIEASTYDTTKYYESLWDKALNRVEKGFADTFAEILDTGNDFVNDLIRIFAEGASAISMEILFGVNTGSGTSGTLASLLGISGSGSSGSGTSWLSNLLGLGKTGYELYSGESLMGTIVSSVQEYLGLGNYAYLASNLGTSSAIGGSAYAGSYAGMFAGMTDAEIASMVGSATGSYTTGTAMAGMGASMGIAAAAAAAIFIANAIFDHNMGPDYSSLQTKSSINLANRPDAIFTGEMFQAGVGGGTWSEEDAQGGVIRIGGMIADSLNMYNSIFANLGEESQKKLRATLDDSFNWDNIFLGVRQEASTGAPISAWMGMETPNEITESEWTRIIRGMTDYIASADTWDPLRVALEEGLSSQETRDAIVKSIESNGELTGQALADILGVGLEDLQGVFGNEYKDELQNFLDSLNEYYVSGYEAISGGQHDSVLAALNSAFGDYFVDYISEALDNVRAAEVFQYMTDDIQTALNSLDASTFVENVEAFNAAFTENAQCVAAASSVWEDLNAFVGRSSDQITAYEKALTLADAKMTGYLSKLAQYGITPSEEDQAKVAETFVQQFLGGIVDLNAAVEPAGDMAQMLAALNGQFDAYLILLQQYGVDLAKITDLETLRTEATERLLEEYKIQLGLYGEGYAEAQRMEEIEQRYRQFGLSTDQLIEAFKNASLAQLQVAAQMLGIGWTDIADDIAFLTGVTEEAGTTISTVASQIRANLDALRSEIGTLTGSGAQSSAAIAGQIEAILGKGAGELTLDNLLGASELMSDWLAAAAEEARAAVEAQREQYQNEIDLLYEQRETIQMQIRLKDAVGNLVGQIDNAIRNIRYSDLNVAIPRQKAEEAKVELEELYRAALEGGTAEIQEFLSFAPTALRQYQEEHKSDAEYQRFFNQVAGEGGWMETIRGLAETGSYDEAILSELQGGNDELRSIDDQIQALRDAMDALEPDYSEMEAQFESWAAEIESLIAQVEKLDEIRGILEVEWKGWTGDVKDAMEMLLTLLDVYGPENEIVLRFLSTVPLDLFPDLNSLAAAAGWIAKATGGFGSTATLAFIKHVASDWHFENIDQILASIGWLKQATGSWTSTAVITFVAELMDRYNVPITQIDYWLTQMGITDTEIAREVKVRLIYTMVSSGSLNMAEVAEFAYNEAYAAWMSPRYSAEAVEILRTLEALAKMWGVNAAGSLGHYVNAYGGYTVDPAAWASLWQWHGRLPTWGEGAYVTSPTLGWVGEAGYPEVVLPMKDGYVPAKIINGGSTQAGADRPIELSLTIQLDPITGTVRAIAREEAEEHRFTLVRAQTLLDDRRQPIECS